MSREINRESQQTGTAGLAEQRIGPELRRSRLPDSTSAFYSSAKAERLLRWNHEP